MGTSGTLAVVSGAGGRGREWWSPRERAGRWRRRRRLEGISDGGQRGRGTHRKNIVPWVVTVVEVVGRDLQW